MPATVNPDEDTRDVVFRRRKLVPVMTTYLLRARRRRSSLDMPRYYESTIYVVALFPRAEARGWDDGKFKVREDGM